MNVLHLSAGAGSSTPGARVSQEECLPRQRRARLPIGVKPFRVLDAVCDVLLEPLLMIDEDSPDVGILSLGKTRALLIISVR